MAETWSLFTNHGRALLALARNPELRLREIAAEIGVTDRAAQAIVNDLVASGHVERVREGRRNRYTVHGERPIRHPVSRGQQVSALLAALVPDIELSAGQAPRTALVLGCTDHRFQEPLLRLLAAEGLMGSAEIFLWPGGSAALGGDMANQVLEAMSESVREEPPDRVVLTAHQGCRARGARVQSRRDALETGRAVTSRRRRGVERARKTFGVEPELWFLTERLAYRAKSRREFHAGGSLPLARGPRAS
jgi:DNA-binding MarR family transcriptional regulator